MPEQTTDWQFDADRDDPLTALRIPVTSAYPAWRYIATFDRESEARPTDAEAAMLASFIREYIEYWYTDSFKARLAERPLDVDGGCNTVIFRKYRTDDWGYRLDSWRYGPMFVPQSPQLRETSHERALLGPLSLAQVMDRVRSFGDDGPLPRWLEWKAKHPDVFPPADGGS